MSDDLIERAETALADGNGNAYLYAGLLREAINEVKRQDDGIAGLMKETAKWRAIAIDERAKVLYFAHAGDDMYDVATLEEADRLKERHMQEAANELDLQISQEASHLDRLEKEFVDLAVLTRFWTEEEAREALAKIRAGDT